MSNQFDRPDIERATLACLCQNPETVIEVDGKLSLNDFSNPTHRELFNLIIDLYNSDFESFTKEDLSNQAIRTNKFDPTTIEDYVEVIFDLDVNTKNITKYVETLLDNSLKRDLFYDLHKGIDLINTMPDTYSGKMLLNEIQGSLLKLTNIGGYSGGPEDIAETIKEDMNSLLVDKESNLGVPCGIDEIDDITLGWLKKKFYFVAARPGQGKSAFLMGSAIHAAFFAKVNKCSVLYLDTEMDKQEWFKRGTSHLSGVDHTVIMKGMWDRSEAEMQAVNKALNTLSSPGHIYFEHVPDFGIEYITAVIRKYVYMYNIGLIIFDYIKLPEDADLREMQQHQHIFTLAKRLKYLCKTLDVPIISALQQNREGEGKSHVDTRSFAESDGVLKECDMAFALNRKTSKQIEQDGIDYGTHIFQILKARYNRPLFKGLNLFFKGYCFRFFAAKKQDIASLRAEEKLNQPDASHELRKLNTQQGNHDWTGQFGSSA
jgi:replicative DNA helicase